MVNSKNSEVAGQILSSLAEAQVELDALRRELEASHRLALVGTMAAGLAHEINNLLTPVLAHAQIATSRPGDLELQARTLQKVMRGVKDASTLTRTILGLAGNRTDTAAGGADHARPHANVRGTADAAIGCLVREPAKDGIELINRIRPDLDARMEPILLQQVLLNLILNAQRAMARRGGRITLSADELDADRIEIEVSDNGPGIPATLVDRLFEPLARRRIVRAPAPRFAADPASNPGPGSPHSDAHGNGADDTNGEGDGDSDAVIAARAMRDDEQSGGQESIESGGTPPPAGASGSGLGLATCRLLIEHAGGRIAVRSAPDHGATFTIILPRATPTQSRRAAG